MPIDAKLMEIMRATMPPFFSRSDVGTVTNGAIAPGYMAKLAAEKKGPPIRYFGTKSFYVKEEFLAWAEEYYKTIGSDSLQNELAKQQEFADEPPVED